MIVKSINVKIDKIKVMKRYTLKVDNGDGTEKIWSGDDLSTAIHYEAIAIKHWGSDAVWICDNLNELTVG
tara:strand:+ start:91 stop:300 length:210 start_codon:yes stop_codon:yes gene_type:complete